MPSQSIKLLIFLFSLFIIALSFNSCTAVKEYQKMYVNDKDMKIGNKSIEQFEGNMEVFREGAAGANGGKSGGGCACN